MVLKQVKSIKKSVLSYKNRSMLLRKINKEFLVIIGVYIILTILVWGLFAFDRGMWHDEILLLYIVLAKSGGLLAKLFVPAGSPTRILQATPFALAQWSGSPVFVMQALYGLTWFSTGVLAYVLTLRLFPRHIWLAFIVAALTLSASSDFTTNSLFALGISMSVGFYFASVVCLIMFWQNGSRMWLLPTGLCLSLSVWIYDATFAAVLLTPALLWALEDLRFTKRLLKVMIFWYGLIVPYLIVFTSFLLDPSSYAGRALLPMTLAVRFKRTIMLFSNNFTPWIWALNRRQWFPALPSVLPGSLRFALALAGTIAFLLAAVWLLNRQFKTSSQPREESRRFILVCLISLLMAFSSNAIYSSVHFSDVFLRTHWVSRVWASLAVSLLSYGLGLFVLKRPYIALILPTIFLGFGIYGGLERQDYYLAYWRQHKAALQSIVEQIPGLKPDAQLIIYAPPGSPYLPTTATYLAQSWISYLYEDPSLATRVFLWSKDRNSSCKAESHAFVCQGEGDPSPVVLKYSRSVLLIYSPAQNRYVLQDHIPSFLIGNAVMNPGDYNPKANIVNRPLPNYVYSVLYGSQYLGAIFSGEYSPISNINDISFMENPRAGTLDILHPLRLKCGESISAAGWAMDPSVAGPAKEVIIVSEEGKLLAQTTVNEYRPDVADYFKNKSLLHSGWRVTFDIFSLSPGTHTLRAYVFLRKEKKAVLLNREFNVTISE